MSVLEARKSDVVGGKDKHLYTMYNCNTRASASVLAKIANAMQGTGVAPDSFKTNIVSLLPKVEDPYHTGLYRPITLANADYKIIMTVWAKRLGPVLNDVVMEHQKGFIPGRDGRENVILVQSAMDKLAEAAKGAGIFLDLEKAFDMVSHRTLKLILEKYEFPLAIRNTVEAVYDGSEVYLQVNGLKVGPIPVKSGTKQGCPISPLLFTLVAEMLTQCIVRDKDFIGVNYGEFSKKVAAYADDTAILCADAADFDRALYHLDRYERATGMKRNVRKTEIVSNNSALVERATALGYAAPKETKYLGCPVGINPNYDAMWEKIINKMKIAAADWNTKSSAVGDRVFIAKTMLLSKVWYHGSILPIKKEYIDNIEKIVKEFVWNGKVPKIGRYQMRKDKKNNGLKLWDIESKIQGLKCNWILSFLQEKKSLGLLKDLLVCEIGKWSELGFNRGLLLDPDDNRERIHSKPLAEIIYAWSKISRPCLVPEKGDWISKVVRKTSRGNLVEESLVGTYQVDRIFEEKIYATEYCWEGNKLEKWGSAMILDNQAVPIESPNVKSREPVVTREYLVNTKKYANTVWYSEAEDMKGYVDKQPFKGKAKMTTREFGPYFFTEKKMMRYISQSSAIKKCSMASKKKLPPKLIGGKLTDLEESMMSKNQRNVAGHPLQILKQRAHTGCSSTMHYQ